MSESRLFWMAFSGSLFFFTPRHIKDGVVGSWQLADDALVPIPSAWQPVTDNTVDPVFGT